MPKLTDWLIEQAVRDGKPPKPPKPQGLTHAWYQVGGRTVHVDGAGLPRPCVRCRAPSAFACDFPVTEGVTCDAPLCTACAKEIGLDRHLCPLHVNIAENRKGSLL